MRRTALLTLVLALALALFGTSVALAAWSDLSADDLDGYGITEAQVQAISQGYPDGTWRPWDSMPRRQFVRMALPAFDLPTMTPAAATFTDVPTGHPYFADIEGAVAAGLVQGVTSTLFGPDQTVTREQAIAIVAREAAKRAEVDLDSLTEQQIAAALAPFSDASQVSASLRAEMAFAVGAGIVQGSGGLLKPKEPLARIQGAALLIRAAGSPAGSATAVYDVALALSGTVTANVGQPVETPVDKTAEASLLLELEQTSQGSTLTATAEDVLVDGEPLAEPLPPVTIVKDAQGNIIGIEGLEELLSAEMAAELLQLIATHTEGLSLEELLLQGPGGVMEGSDTFTIPGTTEQVTVDWSVEFVGLEGGQAILEVTARSDLDLELEIDIVPLLELAGLANPLLPPELMATAGVTGPVESSATLAIDPQDAFMLQTLDSLTSAELEVTFLEVAALPELEQLGPIDFALDLNVTADRVE